MKDIPPDFQIHILYDFVEGPWGGGNQFLKALRKQFRNLGVYTESAGEADVILFNSFNSLFDVVGMKQSYPEKVFVHRIDGPISKVRGWGQSADRRIYHANEAIADGTIFQSEWSRARNLDQGMEPTPFETQVLNAPDPDIFNDEGASTALHDPVKLIATSWSDNYRKGFDVYEFLDQHLDFDEYEFTFVGNSPVEFENIDHVDPVPPSEVGEFLKEHDVFVTASRADPCSNSLIEALHCGLPAAVLDAGGHPEIVGSGGVLFSGTGNVVEKLDEVVENYEQYQRNIDLFDIEKVGRDYAEFCLDVYRYAESGDYDPKRLPGADAFRVKAFQTLLEQRNRVENLVGRGRDWLFRERSLFG